MPRVSSPGRLFSIETYLGLRVALLALLLPVRARFLPGFVAVGLLAVNEWVLKPAMRLAQAHGGTALFELRCLARYFGRTVRAGLSVRPRHDL